MESSIMFEKKLDILEKLGVVDLTQQYDILGPIFPYTNYPTKESMNVKEYQDYLKSKEFKERNKQKNKFKKFIMSYSKKLNEDEEKTFSLQHGECLYLVNNQYIVMLHDGNMSVYSNAFEHLFSFSANGEFLSSSSFFFQKTRVNDVPIFEFFGNMILDNGFKIILEKDCIKIIFTSSIKKISMKDNNYIVSFSDNLYSDITFNKSLDIVDVSISELLKKELNVDLKINNVQTYSDISQKINSHIKDDLEVYTLINDKKLIYQGSQEQFDQDMLLFKESIKYINSIESLYEDIFSLITIVSDFYSDVKNYIPSDDKNNQTAIHILNNINILEKYKKEDKNFINTKIFSEIKKTVDLSNKIVKFTYDLYLNIKPVKK